MENLMLNSNQHRKLKITSLDAPLDWILVRAHENPDGSMWREGVAISTEAKLLSILVVLTWRTLYSLNRTQMNSSVSASERLAIMMRSSGPRSGSRQGPAVKCIAKVDMAPPHNHLSLLLLYTRYFDK